MGPRLTPNERALRWLLPCLSGFLVACGSAAEVPESVLLVTLDTTRADLLTCRGELGELFPTFCGLARDGVRFPVAYTVVPLTLPAHASMMSGLYPPRHGVRDNGIAALPGAATTIAELARLSGRRTAAFVATAILDRAYGLDQGFELYDQPELRPRDHEDFYLERDATVMAGRFTAWLEGLEDDRGFFAWLHFYDAHLPYEPPSDCLERAKGDPYRGELVHVDRALASVLGALERAGRERSTWVVLTADHGEALGGHGEPTHGALCYDETTRVPLFFRPPSGREVAPAPVHFASVVDLYPTLLGLMGLDAGSDTDGIDLFGTPDQARGVYVESYSGYLNYGWSPLAGWVDGYGKYLHSATPELYLRSDPDETHNVVEGRRREAAHARECIAEVHARPRLPQDVFEPRGELQRALWELGYAGGAYEPERMPSPLAETDRPGPLERLHELELLHRGEALFDNGRHAEARELAARILEGNGKHLMALDLYAISSMYVGEWRVAEETWRRRLELDGGRADAHLNLGLCLEVQGELDAAIAEVERAAELNEHEHVITDVLERLRAERARR